MSFTQKKTFKLILLSTLLFVTTNNLFSENIELKKNVEVEEAKEQKESPSQIYYKQNPWAFIERELISVPNAKSSNWLQALIKTGIFFGTSIGIGLALDFFIFQKKAMGSEERLTFATIPGLVSGILSLIFYCKWLKIFTNLQNLKNFLDNYNPNLEKLGVNNNKRYVPEELHETFNTLYEGYQKEDGDEFLKDEGFEVLRIVMEKIIYQINPKKYEIPIQIYRTSYPVDQGAGSIFATKAGSTVGSNQNNYLSMKLF